ncbi:Osmosensitive K+ channel histidine kinase KdpD [Microbacterium esteraromaticum]|uniref:histidine kinase n=2 Tax=Microbacterium esteraromaticum TaxID=57043 RepID=A0A1R4JTR5_9MICO|nr:ATP-binding protein [Microbacterium esteraromaticum]SJN35205.1 Osmosensitive K+ channel histidine kinase KdpD [Microbacterium esteraromaticum]
MRSHPLSLQARLMAAVIGFVSLILVIVAIITSATLGSTLEQRLQEQVDGVAVETTTLVNQRADAATFLGQPLTAEYAMSDRQVQGISLLLLIAPPGQKPSGMIITPEKRSVLSSADLATVTSALQHSTDATVNLTDFGSYRVKIRQTDNGVVVVTGLSRAEVQHTMTSLFTVIALATLGGLILLALTTALTISMGLRPLRAVAATATRVAGQPLDRGEVNITERVPDYEADPRTEVGRVGVALNTLLDHVDTSLSARQRNEERMRRFVADASHELRTPLASIRGYSELSLRALKQGQSAETVQNTTSALERIQAQSLRMTRLVEDLLLLARLDEGQELVHGTVDLTRLAVEALADAQPTAPGHIWKLELPEEPVTMTGDTGRLHQVLANLLANARTHTPDGTTITLSLTSADGAAELRVHDDGPGIDPQVRDELFARFARGDISRARKSGGTGLGLAIAKAIVEGHGGTVSVTSDPGDTTFIVRLPAAPPVGPAAPVDDPSTAQ